MSPAQKLASWLLQHGHDLSHLKLQKLLFYCYGIASASAASHREELGLISFHAWQHGPVCSDIYHDYKTHGSAAIPAHCLPVPVQYTYALEQILSDVLTVYGGLSAWQLRQQSHLEKPWSDAKGGPIDDQALVDHFQDKFKTGQVIPPEYVGGGWSLELDRIHTRVYSTFHELAQSIRNAGQVL